MGDERQFTKPQTTYSQKSGPSRSPHQAAYAAERAKLLFGCYRRGDANDPETYVAAVAAVLSRYDTDLIREVTDPNTGIMTTEKFMTFMPSAGELKVYCEALAGRKERLNRLGSLPKPLPMLPAPPARPGDLANVRIPPSNPRYAKWLEWAQANPDSRFCRMDKHGLWIAYCVLTEHKNPPRETPTDEPEMRPLTLSEDALRAMRSVDAERNGETPADQREHA